MVTRYIYTFLSYLLCSSALLSNDYETLFVRYYGRNLQSLWDGVSTLTQNYSQMIHD